MANEKSVLTKRFINGLRWETKKRYLERINPGIIIKETDPLDSDSVSALLNSDGMEETKAQAIEDLKEIRDIARGHIEARIFNLIEIYGEEIDTDNPIEEILLQIKLTNKKLYNEIVDNFEIMHRNKLSCHHLEGKMVDDLDKAKEKFREESIEYFQKKGKGSNIEIHWYFYEDEFIAVVLHGSYMKSEEYWKSAKKREQRVIRPVRRDVVKYNEKGGALWVAAQSDLDKKYYWKSFAKIFFGIEINEIDEAQYQKYTLKPIQDGTFNFDGEREIINIELREVEFRDQTTGNPITYIIKGKEVGGELEARGIKGRFKGGELLGVKLGFKIEVDGHAKKPVVVVINPPFKTDLLKKRHSELIEAYLKKYGVALN